MLLFSLRSAASKASDGPATSPKDYALLRIYQKITQAGGITIRFDRIKAYSCVIWQHIRRNAESCEDPPGRSTELRNLAGYQTAHIICGSPGLD